MHNTMNPVPSIDPCDGEDNLQALDEFMHTETPTYTDRLHQKHISMEGMRQRFNDLISSMGFIDIGEYGPGLEITMPNQIFSKDGEYWKPGPGLDLPYTTTGDWATEGEYFLSVGDAFLRQQLADAETLGSGSDMVAHRTSDDSLTHVGDELRKNETDINSLASNDSARGLITRPAFLEQHFTGFFGRGMFSSEANSLVTETGLVQNSNPGSSILHLENTTYNAPDTCITVMHDNGKYGTYYVIEKTGNALGIVPRLRYAASAGIARAERTWYNRAHPGKFYMRELAQRIAHSTEIEAGMAHRQRVLYSNINANDEGDIKAVGASSTVTIYAASNSGDPTVRFGPSRTAYVEVFASNQGASTPFFDTNGATSCLVNLLFGIGGGSQNRISARVVDQDFRLLASYVLPATEDSRVLQFYKFGADVRGAKKIAVEFMCHEYSAGGYFTINNIDVFDAPDTAGKVIEKRNGTIVVFGDSWASGDWGTSERESIATQLALELPDATVVRSGVGGNNINNLIDRFQTDVPHHNPDYVAIVVGTNDAYQNISPSDFTGGLSTLFGLIASIGARPILIGPPALAQSDAEAPSLGDWELNDRAKAYERAVLDWQHEMPIVASGANANGNWVKFQDGTMECRHTVSISVDNPNVQYDVGWDFPHSFSNTPSIITSLVNYGTNQLVSIGSRGPTNSNVIVSAVTSVSASTVSIFCIAKGRWR